MCFKKKIMKTFLLALIILASLSIGLELNRLYEACGRIVITGVYQDERGYTSVTFIQDGKEYGLDYLTKDEYLKLINNSLLTN